MKPNRTTARSPDVRKDYHMHPTVVQTPERFEQFARQAVQKNIREICVTDHMPLSFSRQSDRIPHGMIGEYCAHVRRFAEEYRGTLSVKCGIEIDYHPSVLNEIERVLEEGTFDYILASSHMHVFVKDYARYTFDDYAELSLENLVKAVESGLFCAVAHLDMYRWAFDDPVRFPLIAGEYLPARHEALIRELLRKIREKDMFLEINPHLAEAKGDLFYTYPQDTVTQWALREGVKFSYGSDAHKPDSVGALIDELENHPTYGKALRAWENL